jgi:hypothetical protein
LVVLALLEFEKPVVISPKSKGDRKTRGCWLIKLAQILIGNVFIEIVKWDSGEICKNLNIKRGEK